MIGDSGPPRFASSYFDIMTGGQLSPQDAFEPVTRLFGYVTIYVAGE